MKLIGMFMKDGYRLGPAEAYDLMEELKEQLSEGDIIDELINYLPCDYLIDFIASVDQDHDLGLMEDCTFERF